MTCCREPRVGTTTRASAPTSPGAEILEKGGNEYVKDVRFTAGCANPVGTDGALVQFDDLTINHEVIDFNYRSIEPR